MDFTCLVISLTGEIARNNRLEIAQVTVSTLKARESASVLGASSSPGLYKVLRKALKSLPGLPPPAPFLVLAGGLLLLLLLMRIYSECGLKAKFASPTAPHG